MRGSTESFGTGARGFNVYLSSVQTAEFDQIVTNGDAAVGVELSHRIGKLTVRSGIQTSGAQGPSLVKDVMVDLDAVALNVQDGARLAERPLAWRSPRSDPFRGRAAVVGGSLETVSCQENSCRIRASQPSASRSSGISWMRSWCRTLCGPRASSSACAV